MLKAKGRLLKFAAIAEFADIGNFLHELATTLDKSSSDSLESVESDIDIVIRRLTSFKEDFNKLLKV